MKVGQSEVYNKVHRRCTLLDVFWILLSQHDTHSDSNIGRFLPNNESIELLNGLLFALAFKTLRSQLSQGLVELLKRDYTS